MSAVYISNEGEKEAIKSILLQRGITIGLFGNACIPDGSTLFSTLTELQSGPTYGYNPVNLENVVKESATPTAGMWTITTNSSGKASAVYGAAALSWVFLATDVALLPTVYGYFMYSRVLPFTAGVFPIKVGDVVRQGAAVALVTGVNVSSGSFAAGTAAGDLYLKNQSGVFVTGATLVGVSNPTLATAIKGLTATPVAAGTLYAVGDIFSIGTGTGGVGRVTAISGGGATGPVTAVELLAVGSTYAVATAATTAISGTGDNALTVAIATLYATQAPTLAVATIAGDSAKRLLAVEALTTPVALTVLGQSLSVQPTLTMASG